MPQAVKVEKIFFQIEIKNLSLKRKSSDSPRGVKKIPKDKPFRGPRRFKKDNFQYLNKIKGTVEKFKGEEKIFYKGKLVYGLVYHGGIILEK